MRPLLFNFEIGNAGVYKMECKFCKTEIEQLDEMYQRYGKCPYCKRFINGNS